MMDNCTNIDKLDKQCCIKLSKKEALAVLLFLSYHDKSFSKSKTLLPVSHAKNKIRKQLSSIIDEEDLSEFSVILEIHSSFD